MTASIEIAADRLPADEVSRAQILARYFQRQEVSATRRDKTWQVEARWTGNPAYYIDPELAAGLDSWSSPLTTASIPLAVNQEEGFLLGLNDCWSLLSWSLWLSAPARSQDRPGRITLIHLDSHTDLNSPRLRLSETQSWQDILTGQTFDLYDPRSVAAAIMSGAIGIGSFICPLLASGIVVDLFHVSPPQHFRFAPDQYELSLELDRNDALFADAVRPNLRVGPAGSASSYVLTEHLAEVCNAVDTRYPVFLHIDLDYFNNRFDGDPNWRGCAAPHDPGEETVLAEVDSVFEQLTAGHFQIADISIGVSPGFFPAELWNPTLKRVRDRITSLMRARP